MFVIRYRRKWKWRRWWWWVLRLWWWWSRSWWRYVLLNISASSYQCHPDSAAIHA